MSKQGLADDYVTAFRGYLKHLPRDTVASNNLLPSDDEARTIRNMFQQDHATLGNAARSRLSTFLQSHQGLRVFYPGIARFYSDVRNGAIAAPLPFDATSDFCAGVRELENDHFEREVADTFGEAAENRVTSTLSRPPSTQINAADIQVPPDPLGEIDLKKANDVSTASKVNELWKTVTARIKETGEAVDGAGKIYDRLKEPAKAILDWLRTLSGGDGPPSLPPTIGV